MTITADTDIDKMIHKIVKLVSQADHPDTSEIEAGVFRQKAAELMDRYDIYEAMLVKARPSERVIPVVKRIPVYPVDSSDDSTSNLTTLLQILARHVQIRINFDWKREKLDIDDAESMTFYTAAVVGYDADIRYLEVLYAQLRMHVITNLSSKWNPLHSLEENVTRLHESGVGYDKIADLAVAAGFPEYHRGEGELKWTARSYTTFYPNAKSSKAKLMRVYDAYCKKNNREKVMTPNPQNYRMWFLNGYVDTIRTRVYQMAEMRKSTMDQVDIEMKMIGGSALALRDRGEQVQDAFYNFFPDLRPDPNPVPASAYKTRRGGAGSRGGRVRYVASNYDASRAGSEVAKTADLSGGRNNLGQRKQLGS